MEGRVPGPFQGVGYTGRTIPPYRPQEELPPLEGLLEYFLVFVSIRIFFIAGLGPEVFRAPDRAGRHHTVLPGNVHP